MHLTTINILFIIVAFILIAHGLTTKHSLKTYDDLVPGPEPGENDSDRPPTIGERALYVGVGIVIVLANAFRWAN
jgi:hypothetical protein